MTGTLTAPEVDGRPGVGGWPGRRCQRVAPRGCHEGGAVGAGNCPTGVA